jgi:hypothetical protein
MAAANIDFTASASRVRLAWAPVRNQFVSARINLRSDTFQPNESVNPSRRACAVAHRLRGNPRKTPRHGQAPSAVERTMMSTRNTVIRSLHDLGAAAWFGGSLMGAVGLNGASAAVRDSQDRARVSAAGWMKWAPVNAAAIGAHLAGGGAILYNNRKRAKYQSGVTSNTIAKIAVTGAALGATAYSGVLGTKAAQRQGHPVQGATEPSSSTPDDVASAQQQLRYVQWVLPILTGTIILLGAQQGEQQRPSQIATGLGNKLARRAHN